MCATDYTVSRICAAAPRPAEGLKKLKELSLDGTKVTTDAVYAGLAAAIDSDALPALTGLQVTFSGY